MLLTFEFFFVIHLRYIVPPGNEKLMLIYIEILISNGGEQIKHEYFKHTRASVLEPRFRKIRSIINRKIDKNKAEKLQNLFSNFF